MQAVGKLHCSSCPAEGAVNKGQGKHLLDELCLVPSQPLTTGLPVNTWSVPGWDKGTSTGMEWEGWGEVVCARSRHNNNNSVLAQHCLWSSPNQVQGLGRGSLSQASELVVHGKLLTTPSSMCVSELDISDPWSTLSWCQ